MHLANCRFQVMLTFLVGCGVFHSGHMLLAQEKRAKTEHEVATEQLEVMRSALPALRETGRKEAAVQLQNWIRAQEVILERRRGEEAEAIRERAPKRGQLVEILMLSAKLWREFGDKEKAATIGQLAEQIARREQRDTPRGRDGDRGRAERGGDEQAVARQQLDIMRAALPALREGERREATALLEKAILVRELQLAGRRDEEARTLIQLAPTRAQQAEALGLASKLWREFDQEEKAVAVGRLAEQYAARKPDRGAEQRRERERPETRERSEQRGDLEARVSRLEKRLDEMLSVLEALRKEMKTRRQEHDQ